jgi:cell division protein FtsB
MRNNKNFNRIKFQITSQNLSVVDTNEYNNLVNEHNKLVKDNNDMNAKILQLVSNERILEENKKILQETTSANNKMIDELKKENDELKKENNKLKKKVEMLENNYKIIRDELDEIKMNKLYNKYIVAIQDLNGDQLLEKKTNDQLAQQSLEQLRSDRINDCHYLDRNHSNEKNDRINELLKRINNMPSCVRNDFDIDYPNVLTEICNIVKPTNTLTDQKTMRSINRWWNS